MTACTLSRGRPGLCDGPSAATVLPQRRAEVFRSLLSVFMPDSSAEVKSGQSCHVQICEAKKLRAQGAVIKDVAIGMEPRHAIIFDILGEYNFLLLSADVNERQKVSNMKHSCHTRARYCNLYLELSVLADCGQLNLAEPMQRFNLCFVQYQ